MAPGKLGEIDRRVKAAVSPEAGGLFPGMVLLVAKEGVIVKHEAYGWAQTYEGGQKLASPRPMTVDTVFDMASITKVLATTAAVMALLEEGTLGLTEPVAAYVPEFWQGGKEHVTLFDLLTHSSGLEPWVPVYLHASNRKAAQAYVLASPKVYPRGTARRYSDLGFMVLGAVVERVTGQRLDAYVTERIYRPLGMGETMFLPPGQVPALLRGRIAATSFGNPYEYRMIADPDFGAYLRYYGHGGFTGTELSIDPDAGLIMVILTNRLHPDMPYGHLTELVREILRIVYEAIPKTRGRVVW